MTGGGRGIGRAIALRLAGAGAHVGVLDVDADTAAETAQMVSSHGRHGVARRVDVRDHGAVRAAVKDLAAELGRIDVLVNNAGVETRSSFLDIAPDEWERQVEDSDPLDRLGTPLRPGEERSRRPAYVIPQRSGTDCGKARWLPSNPRLRRGRN